MFILVVAVDIVCGPLLTLVLLNPKKSRKELILDVALVASVQLAALAYGLHSIAIARPVAIAFEVDRFRVVAAADLMAQPTSGEVKSDGTTQNQLRVGWFGPIWVGTRLPKDSDERFKSLDLSLQGYEPSSRLDWWQAYELSLPDVLSRAKPLASLNTSAPGLSSRLEQAVKSTGLPPEQLKFLPLLSHKQTDWIVLLDPKGKPISFAQVDGF